jgi:hypothetical protein
MRCLRSLSIGIVSGLAIAILSSPAWALSYSFSGIASDGVGSATMTIDIVGNTLTAILNNTSPITNVTNTGGNAPGISGFGFNLNLASANVTSWSLSALNTSLNTLTIGSSAGGGLWSLGTTIGPVTADFAFNNGAGVNGALFNPAALGLSQLPGGGIPLTLRRPL